jgi:deoxyribodipyrimidine photolyase-related protein
MSGTLRLVLGDQLSRGLASLRDVDPVRDVVLFVEVAEETRYVPHHKQKIVLVLSAMRHFAATLRAEGLQVDYVTLDAPGNTGSLREELKRALARHRPARVVLTEPGEWRMLEMMQGLEALLGVPVDVRSDDRFLCSRADFAQWMRGRRAPRMEHFYRDMRRRTRWLMDGDQPVGGAWNFDADNRQSLPPGLEVPRRKGYPPDAITREVIALVATRCADHFGDLEAFHWAVTREDALDALAAFLREGLPRFGDYQDAMRRAEPWLHHSVLAPYLNIGLLTAREVCEAVLEAGRSGHAPLNAVEGFVRQILGWREYVRGIYWTQMPRYPDSNALNATRPLPEFFWDAKTQLACLRETIRDTARYAYAHHIQRLMVTGNFALLTGLSPAEVERWYLIVYADAFEWVELPNVHGMALYADGGLLASKPYAASGAYIDRMSDYCNGCAYDPKQKSGPRACPFNYLYWYFLLENQARLGLNPRLAMPYRNLARMPEARKTEIRRDAAAFLATLCSGVAPGSQQGESS